MSEGKTAAAPTLTDILFERSPDGLCLVAPDGTVIRANAEWLRSTGFTAEQVVGEDFVDLFPGARDMVLALHARALSGHRVEVPRHALVVNGRETWWEATLEPVPMEAGTGLLITAREVSGRDGSARDDGRVAAEEKYRSLFQHSIDAVFLALPDGTILDANPAACRLHGMTLQELKQAGRAGLVVVDTRHAAAVRQREATGEVRAELTARRKDGSTVPVEVESVMLEPSRPDSPAFVISRDIAARRRAEEELRATMERYERQVRLFDGVTSTTPDFVYVFDREGRFLYANRRLLEVWGMQLPDAIGKTCRQLGYEQWHHDMHMREIAQVIATRLPIKGEVPFRAPLTGIFGVYEYIFTPVLGPDGEVEIIAGTTRDVTERKKTEDALRKSEQRFRALVTATSDVVYEMSADWTEMRLLRGKDFVADTDAPTSAWWDKYILAQDRALVAHAIEHAIRTTSTYELEHRVLRADGTVGWTFSRAVPLRDASGAIAEWFGMASDVTARKRAQEALVAANEKLREADRRKDEFLAMLAHELRNPLAPIRNASYILRHAAPTSDQARRSQEVIERQTQHLTRLVDDLLDVTRIARGKIELRRERVDLREVVGRAADDFRFKMDQDGVAFHVVVPDVTLWADADPTRVAQVVGNLIHNASKFTRRGDEVVVSVAAAEGCGEVRVRDTGAGIDPALLPRVFEPFVQADQSLARTQGGLGLGLALVKGIAELHGGSVRAESAGSGHGAEFIVRIPLAPTAAATDRRRNAAPRLASGGRRVLVVDDNQDAAESLADLVRLLGHSAEVAFDGTTAIEHARVHAPDVVLCDIGLPGMSGYDVARALRAQGRAVQLFAVSGYAQPEDVKKAVEAGFDAHLAKPADIAEIERLLR